MLIDHAENILDRCVQSIETRSVNRSEFFVVTFLYKNPVGNENGISGGAERMLENETGLF